MSNGVSATAAEPDGRTPVNPPTLAGTDHHLQRAPSPESLIPTRSTSPRPTNFSHMRAGISFHRGPLLPRMSLINSRLWRTPPHFWWIPIPPGRSPTPHPFAKSHINSTHTRHIHSRGPWTLTYNKTPPTMISAGLPDQLGESMQCVTATEEYPGCEAHFGQDAMMGSLPEDRKNKNSALSCPYRRSGRIIR